MHKLTIKLSDKSGYNYDLVNDKNGKVIHSWKRSEMLEKWIDGYIPGNGKNFVKYVDKNGSGKIKVAPNKFVIPFRESRMIKLKNLLLERDINESEFMKILNAAKKATGAKDKIPSETKRLCNAVQKEGFHKIDYSGKPGLARKPKQPMYQYYAYTMGWGHSKFKGPAGWHLDGIKFDPILKWIHHESDHSNPFDDSYLKKHVSTDMQAYQITANIRPGSKDVEPAYYLTKDYYKSFDMYVDRNSYFDMASVKVKWWLNKNKVETR